MKRAFERLKVAVLAILILGGFGAERALAVDWIYTARPGDNFWNLAETHLTSVGLWKALQRHNSALDSRSIRPGTRIRIPVRWLRERPANATLISVTGTVTVADTREDSSRAAKSGDALAVEAVVTTGANSTAVVQFANGTEMRLTENSEIEFDRLSAFGKSGMVDTRLRLKRGRVETGVPKNQAPATRFEIHTPSAIAAVRGTVFRLAADESVTRSEVTSGRVNLAGGPSALDVNAGFGTLAERGKAPQPPRPLLPAPDLSENAATERTLSLTLNWPRVPGAHQYRAQVFTSDQRTLLDDRVLSEPRAVFPAPPDGQYVVRVRALDVDGLEGIDADKNVEVDARPVPPTPIEPRKNFATYQAPLRTWWSLPVTTDSVVLQMSESPEFDNLVIDQPALSGTEFTLDELPPPGDYYWRLASRDSDGEIGPFSSPRALTILKVPESVTATAPQIDESEVTLGWNPNPDAAEYHFQLAEDEAFGLMLLDQKVTGEEVTIAKPGIGTY
nr:FecR domain-containing protein [Gammaproteobacteria bacterium]